MTGVLRWDRPAKVMSTEEWQAISADGAPPGVYTPNMSPADRLTWKAKLIGGANPRVEIRKTAVNTDRRNHAQLLIIVDADSVRMSANATVDLHTTEFDELTQAVQEARTALAAKGKS